MNLFVVIAIIVDAIFDLKPGKNKGLASPTAGTGTSKL